MSDDIFSRLFELFDQPGPVNWKLAAEVARHLAGEREPVEPWTADEYRELARLAEFRVEQVSPFPVPTAPDILPVDRRTWAENSLEYYGHLVIPLADSISGAGPATSILAQLSPVLVGLQIGTLVGSLATWTVAGFDAGLPPERPASLAIIVPNVDALSSSTGRDAREVRLWAVVNEVAFRTLSAIPWVPGHLHHLTSSYGAALSIDPAKLGGLFSGVDDPGEMERLIDETGGIEALIGGEAAEGPRLDLEAFLGALTGGARLLAKRAGGDLLPRFDEITDARDQVREDAGTTVPLGVTPVPVKATREGEVFTREVERRYGEDAMETLWSDPSRMPSAAELADPTDWAARVLLDGWTP